MRKFFLSLLFVSFMGITLHADYPEKMRLHGTVLDYQWAHHSNSLALLFLDNNENSFLYILSADPFLIAKKLYLPENYSPRQISWDRNDRNIVFTSRGKSSDNLYQMGLDTGHIKAFLPGEPRIGFIRDILFSSSELWSITWEVDGSIDVFIYSDQKLMTATNTNGSFIETLKWDRDKLFTRSNIDGSYYFSGTSRGGGIALKTWSLDPYTHKVSSSNAYHKDLVNTSSDGNFYLNIITDPYIHMFELWLY